MDGLAVHLWMWCICWTHSYCFTVTYSCISTHFPFTPLPWILCVNRILLDLIHFLFVRSLFCIQKEHFHEYNNVDLIMVLHIGAKNMSSFSAPNGQDTHSFKGSCRLFPCLSSSTRLVKSKYYCSIRDTKLILEMLWEDKVNECADDRKCQSK